MSKLRYAAVIVCLVTAACSGSKGGSDNGGTPGAELTAEVASFDLAAGLPTRFLIGLSVFEESGQLAVSGGSIDLSFSFLGEGQATGSEPYMDATAEFLPIPGTSGPISDQPVAAPAAQGRGVYSLYDFEFDRPGFWEAEATVDLQGRSTMSATSAFEVLPGPLVPAPGDPAPKVDNLTLDTKDAPKEAIDSRAGLGPIPDPELHQKTVAESIRDGHPALVVIATPVYCVSKFCGPVTDMVQELAAEYGGRADFIHIEVWRDFEGQVVNKGAADWILREDTLQEPWVFLVGADGRVVERWDNVATRQDIEPYLQDLPLLEG
ncbi:MAG: hypothetical protein ACRDH9_12165 [Actinomycetota bacterium]